MNSSQSIQSDTQIIASVETIEAYASLLTSLDTTARARLLRVIRALARIAGHNQPSAFGRLPMRYQDEAGHFDNSYPPAQKYTDHSGPRLMKIVADSTNDIATSGGFYYSWKRVTDDAGLYVATDGTLYGSTEEGTGSVGQFAAHPGDHNVEVDVSYDQLDTDEIPIDRLQKAVRELVTIAFPKAKDSDAAKSLASGGAA